MRLTNLAAGIFTLALAGYVGVTTEAPAKGAAQPIPHARANQPTGQPAGRPSSQQNAPQDQGQGPLKVQTNVVNVFATVRNKQHGIVTGQRRRASASNSCSLASAIGPYAS